MPARGEPLNTSSFVPTGQVVVMLFPLKSSLHGKVPPPTPSEIHVLFHVPPKSPKLDAADAVFAVVKLKSKPSVVMCWHAPSISIELPRKDCPPTALVSSSDDPPLVSSMDVPRMVFGVPASTRHAGDDPSTLQTISEDPTSQRGTAGESGESPRLGGHTPS